MKKETAFIEVIQQLLSIQSQDDDTMFLRDDAIKHILRKFSEERPPRYISKGVLDCAHNKGVTLNLKKHGSIHRVNKSGVPIILDYTTTIQDLLGNLKAGDSVSSVLSQNFTAAILKSEDQKLNNSHFRVTRNGDWTKCYEDSRVNIEIEDNPYHI